jgi:hypothetical protein
MAGVLVDELVVAGQGALRLGRIERGGVALQIIASGELEESVGLER